MVKLDGSWQEGCHIDEENRRGPVLARLAFLCEATDAPAPLLLDGVHGVLRSLRGSLPSPQVPRTIVVSGGESRRLVDAASRVFAGSEDRLVLVPADAHGDPALDSLGFALRDSAALGLPALVISGAINAGGCSTPLAIIGDLCRSTGASLAIDVSLAPWAVLDELDSVRPVAAFGALDRWDDELPDTWGLAVLGHGTPTDLEPGLPPEPPVIAPESLRVLDTWTRAALSRRPKVRVWPVTDAASSIGVIGFQIEGWTAAEASIVLAEGFGIGIDALPLSAAPLPPTRGFRGDLMRAVLRPDTNEAVAEALVAGVWSLADGGASRATTH